MAPAKRKAVLIGCPGEDDNYLRGVQHDIKNMVVFLMSERGGSFLRHEIDSLLNPKLEDLSAAIHGISADYLFVYFSGHGYTGKDDRRMICLDGYELTDNYLIANVSKELIIIDACRNIAGATIGGISELGDKYNNATGSRTRDIFNEWIAYSPKGKIIIHATASGTYSYDSNYGGKFTITWLKTANTYFPAEGYDYTPVGVHQLLYDVSNKLQLNNSSQKPCIVYDEGQLQVPFAIAKHEQTPPRLSRLKPFQEPSNSQSQWNGYILFGLIVLVIAAAAD